MFLSGRTGVSCATVGTGTLTLGTALGATAVNLASFQSFANAGIVDQAEVPYLILDSNGNWEYGYGTYTASGTTLTRTVIGSNNSNAAINLSGSEQVFVLPLPSTNGDILTGFPNCLRGFDTALNLQIKASVATNILTVSVTDNAGNAPTVQSPIYIPFRDPTAANGDPIWRRITSALSINTNATGASLGSANSTAFRFWLVAFDNAGTVVLALINCLTPTANAYAIAPLVESQVASTTAMSGSATSAGVFYTPNGTTLSNKAFRILGYIEYNSTGLATAGTYASGPNFIQLMGPGVKLPGDLIQTAMVTTTSNVTNATSSYVATNASKAITPSSAANLIKAQWFGTQTNSSTGTSDGLNSLMRGASAVGPQYITDATNIVVSGSAMDLPNTNASVTYAVGIRNDGGSGTIAFPSAITAASGTLFLEELMG